MLLVEALTVVGEETAADFGAVALADLAEEVGVGEGLARGGDDVGLAGLEEGLLKRPELFVRTLTEKLLIFALGRGIEPFDAPAVRKIVRGAAVDDYRFSSPTWRSQSGHWWTSETRRLYAPPIGLRR